MGKRDRYKITASQFFTIAGSSERENGVPLPEELFCMLEDFCLDKKMPDPRGINSYMLSPEGEGNERILRAGGYVGAMVFKDGTQVELLPMLTAKDRQGNELSNKRILLNMLKSMRTIPLTNYNLNSRAAENLNIFETFILAFINEVYGIVKNGLKQCYTPYENNENFLKGKVIYAKHATKNFAHKDKFYVQYDVFTINRAENRLIKSTLKYLKNITSSARSRNRLESLIANFDGVDYSTNYAGDFAATVIDRSMQGYRNALRWAEIFLLSRYVTVTTGRNVAYAVIFTTGELFDSYTVYSLGKMLDNQRFKAEIQKKHYPMLNKPMPRDSAQALAVMTMRETGMRVVFDSKWQELNANDPNCGIYQTDIYDLYNLLEMYRSDNVCYIYPLAGELGEDRREICFKNEDGVLGRVCFVDIGDMEGSLLSVLEHIFGNLTISKNISKNR
ncbi:MAG: McrC family protein [Oscillospiraceae bacterium]|nr:McrC family protein [Oscillospiraceae bacterium]